MVKVEMISNDRIRVVAAQLAAYRGDGYGAILFDSRDRGNYSDRSWEWQADMLEKADPTGLAMGMMVLEMISATINGSQVRLEKVLCEPGFVESLRSILGMQEQLLSDLSEPRTILVERVSASLNAVSPTFGTPSTREVAICLRDAIYSMEHGLSLRWIRCDDVNMHPHTPLCPEICHFDSLPDFIAGLRGDMPLGAHLVRVGHSHTAIGIKVPGRVAYLSSMRIVSGAMSEDRASNIHMAEHLDLDTPVERYPDWHAVGPHSYGNKSLVVGAEKLGHISQLARDRLLWLAMVVEMASQRMASTTPDRIELVEVLTNALPRLDLAANVPATLEPNWLATDLSVEATFIGLGLDAWESQFLRPALDGLSADMLYRISDKHSYAMSLSTRDITDWPDSRADVTDRFGESHVELFCASPSLAGTQAEVEEDRQRVFGANLVRWLLAWGNHQFEQLWIESIDWFREKLASNLPNALSSPCVTWRPSDYQGIHTVRLFQQHPRRKMHHPMCYFNVKLPVSRVAHFYPTSSCDLVDILGLPGESELPAFLRGWRREQSWTTADIAGHTNPAPFGGYARWRFCKGAHRHKIVRHLLEAVVMVNDASIPEIEFAKFSGAT